MDEDKKEIVKTNKIMINNLIAYLEKQDHFTVCKILANCMLDLHRFISIDSLCQIELESLIERTKHNSNQLIELALGRGSDNLLFTDVGTSHE